MCTHVYVGELFKATAACTLFFLCMSVKTTYGIPLLWSLCPRHFLWDILALFITTSLMSMNCPSLSSSGRTSVVSRMAAESTHPRSAISSVTPPTFDFFYSSPRAVNFLCLCYAFIPVGRFPLYMIHFCKMPPPGDRETAQLHMLLSVHELMNRRAMTNHCRGERRDVTSCWPRSTVLFCFYWVLHGMKN